MNYSCDVFSFLDVVNPLTDLKERLELGEKYYRSVETTEFDTIHEIAISGEIYKVKSLKDYKLSDVLHMIKLGGALLDSLEAGEGVVVYMLLLDLPENNTYKRVVDIIKNSDDTIDIEEIAPETRELEKCLVELLLDEYSRKCDFLMEFASENSSLIDLIKKYSKYEVSENASSYIINSIDSQASSEDSHSLEVAEYLIQEPFPRSAGIVNRTTGEVRLLSDTIVPEGSAWSPMVARSLWRKAGEPENRAIAERDVAMELILRGMDAIQLSLALRGVSVEGGKLGRFKKRRLIKRLKKNLR